MKDRVILLLSFITILYSGCFSQPYVKKINTEDNKAYLKISFKKENRNLVYDFININSNYLTDIEKLQLISCLLDFEGDTTKHPGNVLPIYLGNNAKNNVRFSPKSKYFTIEINALYFIDRIAYGEFSDFYSPAPVLYDNIDNMEINDSPDKIKIVFDSYKKWFQECMLIGEISKYFPFNDGRFVWLHGKKSLFTKGQILIEK